MRQRRRAAGSMRKPAPAPDTRSAATPADEQPDASLRAFFPRLAALGLGAAAWSALPALAQSAPPAAAYGPASGPEPIGVLFPDIGEPLRKVFTDIIDGIEDSARQRVRGYPISPNQDVGELAQVVKRNGTRVVVALGRQGLRAAAGIEAPLGVVVSGISSLPDGDRHIGICLTPDPALLFAQLRALAPALKRVLVVFNPANNDWLMRLAREAARSQGLELVSHEARDLGHAARLYEAAFAGADGRRDALWLPTDSTTVDETTILPLVLREAWNRNVAIFSSSLLHVKKGALFALYPNNQELGRNLGNLARSLMAGEHLARGVTPLRDVFAALNVRTAGHIGIAVTARTQRGFHTLYPEA